MDSLRNNRHYRKYVQSWRLRFIPLENVTKFLFVIGNKSLVETVAKNRHFGDGFVTRNYIGGFVNKRLDQAWDSSFISLPQKIQNWNSEIKYRAHIVTWAANQTKDIEGDFVELGVFYGHLSKVLIGYEPAILRNRKFFLVDPWGEGEANKFENALYRDDIYQFVKNRFAEYPEVELIRGFVPDILEKIPSSKVAFLMIDMNGHAAEIAALEYFYSRMTKGGIIYFDDYGGRWSKLREVVDQFLLDKPEELLTFASPNAILVKM